MAAMRRGDFAAAWRISDAVLVARDPATRDDPRLPYHRRWVWDGRPFAAKQVLVRCYHGLGDSIQFARFLPPLRAQARSLALEVQPQLVPLFAGLPGVDRLIPFRLDAPHPPAECDLELMELPHALGIGPHALGAAVPYLTPPPDRIAVARERLERFPVGRKHQKTVMAGLDPAIQCGPAMAGSSPAMTTSGPDSSCQAPGADGIAVGVCWQAGDWDRERSVPLALLAPLLARPGLRLVSLQRGAAAGDALASYAPALLNPHDHSLDVLDTAALIACLDLVITVDTMVAHLAGALGRPTWLLLKSAADWRWMDARADSPWYPSVRLYRQRRAGDWRAPLARVAADLERVIA